VTGVRSKLWFPQGFVNRVNTCAVGLRASPRWGRVVRRHVTLVTYSGRRSGRTFTTPVGYRRDGATVTIGVRLPDAKTWWRNFLGDGAPISLDLDGGRRGHAVARQDARGRVEVTVSLDD
jgi:hypothetical protein